MNALEILIEARRKIEKPENWMNRMPSRLDAECGRCCAATAIWRTRGYGDDPELNTASQQAYQALATAMGVKIVPDFNDNHTHEEVLAAYDAAIEAERAALSSALGTGDPK